MALCGLVSLLGSPIHDHPCEGCWVRGIEGTVQETRYRCITEGDEALEQTAEALLTPDAGIAYMDGMSLWLC